MIFVSPGDVAFSVLGFPVYFYGIILASACLLAVFIAKVVYGWVYADGKSDLIWDVAPFVVILGILGARLYYCFVNFDYYVSHILEILDIRQGGLSIHGGLIVGVIGLYIAAKKYGLRWGRLLDVFAVGTVLAQSLGRWGNFFNNEAFGLPYNGFLKLYIPIQSRPDGFIDFEYFHPTFFYESVLDFIVFLVALSFIKKYGLKYEGGTFGVYLCLYSIVRFFIEAIRLDSALNIGDLHVAQIASIIGLVVGLMIVLFAICKAQLKSSDF